MDQPVTGPRPFSTIHQLDSEHPVEQLQLKGSSTIWWSSSGAITRIDLDPAALSQPAAARLSLWLEDLSPQRLVWLHFHDGRQPGAELRFGSDAAQKAIHARRQVCGQGGKSYLRHIVDPSLIPIHMAGLRRVLSIWQENHDNIDRSVAGRLCQANDMRLVILRASERGHLIHSSGPGYDACIARWLSANVGSPISSWPDQAYGETTERAYRETASRDDPIHDEIDCRVVWPGGQRNRRRYRRLMLPFRSKSGPPLLVVATQLDYSIDLRSASNTRSTLVA